MYALSPGHFTMYNVQWMLIYEYLSFLSKGDFHGYTLHLTNISHSQYLNIPTWLQDIQDNQDTIAIFHVFQQLETITIFAS